MRLIPDLKGKSILWIPIDREGSENRDHAEQYPTEQESLFDQFESEQNGGAS